MLFLSAVLAMVITAVAVTPASAAPSRSTGSSNRVIFVHGFAPLGKHDCTDYFSAARAHFKAKKWKGKLLTFGYYKGNKRCSYNANGSRGTALKTVAKAFANYAYKNYSKKNIKLDVVAHSMGGLVVRAALYHTAKGTKDFPPRLYIEDVVTLGAPHGGTGWGSACKKRWKQCEDMKQGSAFLKSLPNTMPNSRMGTDWTTISSYDDAIVSETSGIAGIAEHEVQYKARIGHNQLIEIRAGKRYGRIKHSKWSKWYKRVSPVEQARMAVYYSSAM
ncbi:MULTISPECIES: esterase/lipase family protein [unclassified Streptomyces]|uniref:esterase/lipase family protein n=1 Tax=unclassified Streptomyces TaxID=2593676 RepID=UPI0037B2E4BE